MIHSKSLERLVDRLRDVLGVATDHAPRDASRRAKLCSEEDIVPLPRSLEPSSSHDKVWIRRFEGAESAPFTKDHLAVAIRVGGVPKVAAVGVHRVQKLQVY